MFFICLDRVVWRDTLFTPERIALETVETVGASLVAVSTFRATCVALFNGQDIQDAVYSEVGGKLAGISTFRDPNFLATLWT